MRQAGIVAAAGIYALEHMVERLADDHASASVLAEGLASFPQIEIDPTQVQTNIVIFRLRDVGANIDAFIAAMQEQGVLLGTIGYDRLRMVTHDGIAPDDIEETLARVQNVLRSHVLNERAHAPRRMGIIFAIQSVPTRPYERFLYCQTQSLVYVRAAAKTYRTNL